MPSILLPTNHCLYVNPKINEQEKFRIQCGIILGWKTNNLTAYNILGLTTQSNNAEIRKIQKKFSIAFPPDKNSNNREIASEAFKIIYNAIEYVTNINVNSYCLRQNCFYQYYDILISTEPEIPSETPGTTLNPNLDDMNFEELINELNRIRAERQILQQQREEAQKKCLDKAEKFIDIFSAGTVFSLVLTIASQAIGNTIYQNDEIKKNRKAAIVRNLIIFPIAIVLFLTIRTLQQKDLLPSWKRTKDVFPISFLVNLGLVAISDFIGCLITERIEKTPEVISETITGLSIIGAGVGLFGYAVNKLCCTPAPAQIEIDEEMGSYRP